MIHPLFRRRRLAIGFAVVVLLSSSWALACNIPVFRYALERWQPDKLELVVFHSGPLSTSQSRQLRELQHRGLSSGRSSSSMEANVSVLIHDVNALDADRASLWRKVQQEAASQMPFVVVQGRHAKGSFQCWAGPLESVAELGLLQSPARDEMAQRLLAGHALVWCVLGSSDERQNRRLLTRLDLASRKLQDTLQLPEGIGEPGSELFSEVPLLLKFSTLLIDRSNPQEQFLCNLFRELQPDAYQRDEALVIPVFGRGRALEVIPAGELREALIEDLALFLCGACSCQVKEQNPGFDLLMSVDWNAELFGADGVVPPIAESIQPGQRKPVLLTIPPGRSQ